ncbi:MAG: V-type ATP synthase subunit D [Methanoregula sp.]|nr:V-type ATP synthase subunit D [Methanoregula sp.]
MEQVNPTRMELIKKNAQIKLAEQGKDLLREKMDVLIREFFHIMESVSKSRDELEIVAATAQRGIAVPVIEKKRVSKSVLERGYSIIGVSGRIDEAAEKFEMELDLIIELSETETSLKRLGGEIQITRRRVNALEQIMIPELKKQAKYIKNAIDEREREDLFRLKKVKKIIERKKKAAQQ